MKELYVQPEITLPFSSIYITYQIPYLEPTCHMSLRVTKISKIIFTVFPLDFDLFW